MKEQYSAVQMGRSAQHSCRLGHYTILNTLTLNMEELRSYAAPVIVPWSTCPSIPEVLTLYQHSCYILILCLPSRCVCNIPSKQIEIFTV
jgi:hypothetical protein